MNRIEYPDIWPWNFFLGILAWNWGLGILSLGIYKKSGGHQPSKIV